MKLHALAALLVALASPVSAASADEPLRIAVLSDIHIYPNGKITPEFIKLAQRLVELKPDAVVITGDSTNGNPGDKVTAGRVKMWWKRLRVAISPLVEAHIPVLPAPGNHDTYREVHRRGYADAFQDLETIAAPWVIHDGRKPFFYSADLGGTHLSLLNIVDQELPAETRAWLTKDLKRAADADIRLAFGHVPMESKMARPSREFIEKFGPVLADGKVAAYVCGHEHLVWDEDVKLADKRRVRQIIVGTASFGYSKKTAFAYKDCYNFPISGATYKHACGRKGEPLVCTMPNGGYSFRLVSEKLYKEERTPAFMLLEVSGKHFEARPQWLNPGSGRIESFAE
ncbi:MAG: metallophosphoesterase [Deltaproteobacteria bacterium]|nr:metallophosphoesterase [Deltaproteobacteria bacterium]